MKKLLCGFLLLSSLAFASDVSKKEANALKDRLKMYTTGYQKELFL
ncbi:hypothetical protein [Cetobacterium somerae]